MWALLAQVAIWLKQLGDSTFGSKRWYNKTKAFCSYRWERLRKRYRRAYRSAFEEEYVGGKERTNREKQKNKRANHNQHADPAKNAAQKKLSEAKDVEIPSTSEEAVARILSCDHSHFYQILGVSRQATQTEIKKSYRLQSLRVHPDKTQVKGAELAFKTLSVAYDTLGDEEKRAKYHHDLDGSDIREQFDDAFGDKFKDMFNDMKARDVVLQCSNCQELHPKVLTDRPVSRARYCASCDSHHVAHEGEIWAETQYIFRWHFYACLEGKIYEVNDWAECMGLRDNITPNAHDIKYSCKDQTPQSTGRGRKGKKSKPQPHMRRNEFDTQEEFMEFIYQEAMAQYAKDYLKEQKAQNAKTMPPQPNKNKKGKKKKK